MKEKLTDAAEYLSDAMDDMISFAQRHILEIILISAFLWLGNAFTKAFQVPQFGMVDVHEINQSFVVYLAQAELTDEQKSRMLLLYSEALNDELERIGDKTILFSSNQVVTPLEDYTPQIKTVISDALLEANRVHKLP